MPSTPRRSSILALAVLLGLGALTGAEPSPVLASGLSFVPSDSIPVVRSLRTRVRADRRDIEARRELASILGRSGDIELRREAIDVLNEALNIDESDPEIWIQFARLQERRGFRREARVAFRRALDMAPGRADVWGELAQHEFRRFQMYQRMDILERAIEVNDRSLALGPDDPQTIRRALRLAAIRANGRAVDSLCVRWNEVAPEDPWPHLVRGAIDHRLKAWTRAAEAFQRGLVRLDDETRKTFQSLEFVNPLAEEERLVAADSIRYQVDYWRWRDPTPTDDLNPRLLEHYARMVQAEILFGLDHLGLRGWEHSPGEMIVRYGIPGDFRYLDDVERLEGLWLSSFRAPTIAVTYNVREDPVAFVFVDYNLSGRFFTRIEGVPRDQDYLLVANPSVYHPPFEAPMLEQEIELWRFHDAEGNGRIEIAVALDPGTWSRELLNQPYRLASELTLYDETWNPRDETVGSWASFERDDRGRLVALFPVPGFPDSSVIGIETADREERGRAAAYVTLAPQASGPAPILSDIAFLSRVRFEGAEGRYKRGLGSAIPNPGHGYRRGAPIGIAFEGYGFATDDRGLHRARVRVAVSRETRRGLFNVLLRRGQNPPEAELIFDSSEPGPTLDQMLSIQVPPLDTGTYMLRVSVEDRLRGETRTRTSRFEVLPPESVR